MSESSAEFLARVLAAQGDARFDPPPVAEWDTFPFEGDLRVRRLSDRLVETPRRGENPDECDRCSDLERDAVWSDDDWVLTSLGRPSGLPAIVILFPRVHCDLADLSPRLTSALGPMIQRIEMAIHQVGDVGRVHVCRWGDGSAHLHWWFMARPAGVAQLRGSFAPIWDDILPALPPEVWRQHLEMVGEAMARGGGRTHRP